MRTHQLANHAVVLSMLVLFLLHPTSNAFAKRHKHHKHVTQTQEDQQQDKLSAADEKKQMIQQPIINPLVAHDIFDKAKSNRNWKLAFVTGEHAQVVFMNVSPTTNPKNEIGMETHPFDQVIFVVSGNGKAILDSKVTIANAGDMIFIPKGIPHNVINMDAKEPLKIISVYSSNDIPTGAVIKTKDAPKEEEKHQELDKAQVKNKDDAKEPAVAKDGSKHGLKKKDSSKNTNSDDE